MNQRKHPVSLSSFQRKNSLRGPLFGLWHLADLSVYDVYMIEEIHVPLHRKGARRNSIRKRIPSARSGERLKQRPVFKNATRYIVIKREPLAIGQETLDNGYARDRSGTA